MNFGKVRISENINLIKNKMKNKVIKLEKAHKNHPAVWGIHFKNKLYVMTNRSGKIFKTLGNMVIIDCKKNILRIATQTETNEIEKIKGGEKQ